MCPAPSADRSAASKPWRERARLRHRFQAAQRGHRRQGRGQGQESSSSRAALRSAASENCAALILPFQRRVGNEEFPRKSGVFSVRGAKTRERRLQGKVWILL